MLIDIIFPHNCPSCKKYAAMDRRYGICHICLESIYAVHSKVCSYCGKKTPREYNRCMDCKDRNSAIDSFYITYVYENTIKNLILSFKYNNARYLKRFFADKMADTFRNFNLGCYDYITSVPIHRKRLKIRGYNQVDLILGDFTKELSLKKNTKIVCRQKNTVAQYKLKKNERESNLDAAFRSRRTYPDKSVLVLDDLSTTGTTAREIAQTLKDAGFKKIDFLALAHG